MEALWERRLPLSRERSSPLTREEIAAAAFAVAEAENLSAVTVKRIAGRLGIPAARLQHYLTDRVDLLDVMVDVALGEVDFADALDASGWQVQLWHVAHAIRATVQRHTWLSALLGLRAASGPNGLRFSERCLRAVTASGVDLPTAATCVESVLVYVCGSVRPEAVSVASSGQTTAALQEYLTQQVTADQFPLLSQMFARPNELTPDDAFDTGLSYLLAGIANRLAAGEGESLASAVSPDTAAKPRSFMSRDS